MYIIKWQIKYVDTFVADMIYHKLKRVGRDENKCGPTYGIGQSKCMIDLVTYLAYDWIFSIYYNAHSVMSNLLIEFSSQKKL